MHTAIVSEQVSEQMRGLGARGNLGVNKFQEHATVERVKEQRARDFHERQLHMRSRYQPTSSLLYAQRIYVH